MENQGLTSMDEVQTPCFCVNLSVVEENCSLVRSSVAAASACTLRPHTKTHKTKEIAALQTGRKLGEESPIVVSTLLEAEFFADAGYGDILYGVPFETSKLQRVWSLHGRLPNLSIMVDSLAHVEVLESFVSQQVSAAAAAGPDALMLAARRLAVWVSVDAGYGREGALPDAAAEIATRIHSSRRLRLSGLYSHSGNSYNCPGSRDDARVTAQAVGSDEVRTLAQVAHRLVDSGVAVPYVSVGATPSVMAGAVWSQGLTASSSLMPRGCTLELHAGNYPFLDRQQVASGSGGMEHIAVCVLARVIGVYPDRNGGELVIDAGGCALHKDSGGLADWGCLATDHGMVLRKMTQEVSVVGRAAGNTEPIDWSLYPLGGLVHVLPNHSCMTAAMHATYLTVEGPGPGTLHGKPDLAKDIKVTGHITPCKFW